MLISNCWLVLSYRHAGIREAGFAFAVSSGAGQAYAPTHLIRILTEQPARSWDDLLDAISRAEEDAYTQSGDSIPAPLMFLRTEDTVSWESCLGTTIILHKEDLTVEVCWPIKSIGYASSKWIATDLLEESVWRRALMPLGYPDSIELWSEVDGLTVYFALPLAGLYERVISLVNRIPEESFDPPELMIPGIMDGDLVSLLAALDSWEESRQEVTPSL